MSSHAQILRLQQAQQQYGQHYPMGSLGSSGMGSQHRPNSRPPSVPAEPNGHAQYPYDSYGGPDAESSLGRAPIRDPASTTGRTYSKSSNAAAGRISQSLRASEASLVSKESGKSSIQQEYHDRQVQSRLSAAWFGSARTPYILSVVFFIVFVLVLVTGLTLICLRYIYQNIFLTHDKGEVIGPLCVALSFVFFFLGIKFLHDAYQIGNRERRNLTYLPASASTVTVSTVCSKFRDPGEKMVSGSKTENAITRTPHGSRSALSTGQPSIGQPATPI